MAFRPYISQNRMRGLQYIVVPKALLSAAPRLELDVDDAVMYCVLRSRCDLSLRNGWLDSQGRVFIFYTREQMAQYMGWGKKKTIDAFRHLVEAGLIVEEETGARGNTAKRIFVRMWCPPQDEEVLLSIGLTPEEIRQGALPFLRQENIRAMTGSYLVLPRMLLEHGCYASLPLRAKLLYVMTLDRLSLSMEFGQVETLESGETVPYCYLDRLALCKDLQCSERTMTTLFRALEDAELMERRRVSFQPEPRVYLRDFVFVDGPPEGPLFGDEDAKIEPPRRKNRTPKTQESNCVDAKMGPGKAQKSNPSHRPSINQKSYPIESELAEDGEAMRERVRQQWEERLEFYEVEQALPKMVCEEHIGFALEVLDLCGEVLTEDSCFSGRKLRLGQDVMEKEEVLAEYQRLDRYILLTLILKITEQPQIRQLRQYIRRGLFTAAEKHEGESYYVRKRCEGFSAVRHTESEDGLWDISEQIQRNRRRGERSYGV